MKVLGIPTKIDPSFLVLSLFLAASRAPRLPLLLEWLVVVFISVLFHELGHALVARRFGLSPQITLYSMGGLTSWSETKEIAPWKHLAISLAGPAAGFLLGGVIFVAGQPLIEAAPSELMIFAYYDLLWVNIGWGIFNLLPMLPLDGGHVLLTLERWIRGKQDHLISHTISLLVALSITYLAFTLRSFWIALLGVWFAYSNATYLIRRLKASRDKNLETKLHEAHKQVVAENFDVAEDMILEIKQRALTDAIRSEASRLLIFIFIKQKRFKEADEELTRFNGLFGAELFLQGLLSYEKGEMSRAIPELRNAFEQSPDYQLGLALSQALMAEKRYEEVLDLCGHAVMSQARWPLLVNLEKDAFENHEFGISGRAGALAFEEKPDPSVAYNAACAFAQNSDATQALEWLEKAIAAGFNDKNLLATDPDLEYARSHPGFGVLLERMS